MEGGEIDASVMAFEDILNGREVVEGVESPWCTVRSVLSETGDIPDPDCLVLRGRDNQVLLWVKLCRHHVMRVASEDGNAIS